MAKSDDIARLDNYEDEDVFDVIEKLEKSFQVKFDKYAFQDADNFGKLCDIIENKIKYDHQETCTKQQAFYKIREATSLTLQICKTQIKPDTKLAQLFPKRNRRKQVKDFQKQMKVKLRFLTYPDWLAVFFLVGFLVSVTAFFFDWKIAISGITVFILAFKTADYLGTNLQCETVGQLTEKATREHYIDMRRRVTVNKNEIFEVIRNAFSDQLSIDKKYLTKDARFS